MGRLALRACAAIDSRPGMIGRLHERERELGVISGALDEVAAGAGRVVVVEGPAGIGKTSLLMSAREAAQARNFAVAGARGSSWSARTHGGWCGSCWSRGCAACRARERSRTLAGAAALAAPIVLPDGAAPPGDADPSFGVLHGLYWLVAGLAAGRPQLLVVDDLHWADGASVRFVEFLANRIDAVPALLLVAQRPAAAVGRRRAARGAACDVDRALAAVVGGDGGRGRRARWRAGLGVLRPSLSRRDGRQPAVDPPAGGGTARPRHRRRRRRRRGGGDAPRAVRGRWSGGRGARAPGRGACPARARRRGARKGAARDRRTAGRRRLGAGLGVRRAARARRDPARRAPARVRARAGARRGAERADGGRARPAARGRGAHPRRCGSCAGGDRRASAARRAQRGRGRRECSCRGRPARARVGSSGRGRRVAGAGHRRAASRRRALGAVAGSRARGARARPLGRARPRARGLRRRPRRGRSRPGGARPHVGDRSRRPRSGQDGGCGGGGARGCCRAPPRARAQARGERVSWRRSW